MNNSNNWPSEESINKIIDLYNNNKKAKYKLKIGIFFAPLLIGIGLIKLLFLSIFVKR